MDACHGPGKGARRPECGASPGSPEQAAGIPSGGFLQELGLEQESDMNRVDERVGHPRYIQT